MPSNKEPERMPKEERDAPPKAKEPKAPKDGPHVEVIDNPDETPVPADPHPYESAIKGGEVAAQRIAANFKPDEGDWDDPEFIKARDAWAASMDKLAREKPDAAPGPFTAAFVRDVAGARVDPVVSRQPETVAEQTPQMSDGPIVPGNMRKVEVVSTDPSQAQTQHPAGEIADGAPLATPDDIKAMIDAAVADALARERSQQKMKAAPASPSFANLDAAPWKPNKYLRHYRNDVYPQKSVVRRAVDPESDRLYDDPSHKGERIQFVKGHFFATEPWQVEQLDWMRTHTVHRQDGSVLGGDPAIWVDDDDDDVLYCPECRKPFASMTKLQAHRKATHSAAARAL